MSAELVFQAVRLKDYETFVKNLDDVSVLNEEGQTLLHEAAAYDSDECAREIVNKGGDVDALDVKGMTPLHYAAANGSAQVADILVKSGANLAISDKFGNEPLWTAVFNARGNYEIVKLFVDNGANPNHKNNAGRSPVDFANQIKDSGLIAILEG